ncbi:hypothetical protein B0O99DRAFT_686575 [Bisporella sp. PMI_857]|nr:hypothetical protein B0O99DRAFT_686575 [Bisporella sp. PMI_857]
MSNTAPGLSDGLTLIPQSRDMIRNSDTGCLLQPSSLDSSVVPPDSIYDDTALDCTTFSHTMLDNETRKHRSQGFQQPSSSQTDLHYSSNNFDTHPSVYGWSVGLEHNSSLYTRRQENFNFCLAGSGAGSEYTCHCSSCDNSVLINTGRLGNSLPLSSGVSRHTEQSEVLTRPNTQYTYDSICGSPNLDPPANTTFGTSQVASSLPFRNFSCGTSQPIYTSHDINSSFATTSSQPSYLNFLGNQNNSVTTANFSERTPCPPIYDRDSQAHLDYYSPTTSGYRSHRPDPAQGLRGNKRGRSSRSHLIGNPNLPGSISMECDDFIRAQNYINLELRRNSHMSADHKQNLASLLSIDSDKLDSLINMNKRMEPVLKQLSEEASRHQLPPDYITQWFLAMQPYSTPQCNTNDSAYQSKINTDNDYTRPRKKLRTSARSRRNSRFHECTFIKEDGSYCLLLSKNYTDWKRHEEVHWPTKEWGCLVEGTGMSAICSVCRRGINSANHQSCIADRFRQGHRFARKDKLLEHISGTHECQVTIDGWHHGVSSAWKRQCGFCGATFSHWDTRCRHIGDHFLEGKRMVPDWRDPWGGDVGQNSDNDSDNGGNDDDDDNDDDNIHNKEGDNGDSALGGDESNLEDHRKSSTDFSGESGRNDTSKCNGAKRRGRTAQALSQIQIRRGPSFDDLDSQSSGQVLKHVHHQQSETFRFVRKLGYGSFGIVDEVEHTLTRKHFARKAIQIRPSSSFLTVDKAQKELIALRKLKHEHIVKVVASLQSQDQFSFIIYPVANYNLSEFMHSDQWRSAEARSLISVWWGCLTSAVAYIHAASYCHLDLKPANILIVDNRVLISDFGSVQQITASHELTSKETDLVVTPMYCAPEILGQVGSKLATSASDIFSLGCIFLEMATTIHGVSLQVFNDFRSFNMKSGAYYVNIEKSLIWIDKLQDISSSFGLGIQKEFQLIGDMMSINMENRPSARRIQILCQQHEIIETKLQRDTDYFLAATGERTAIELIKIASLWLDDCLQYHDHSAYSASNFFPTRILAIPADGDYIHLQARKSKFTSSYLTLSHCWGVESVPRTTKESLAEMMSIGIHTSSLSRTFRDAVMITRLLGYSYLWIDSLCIIQDSNEDWLYESATMNQVYSNSTLTICVTSTTEQVSNCDLDVLSLKERNITPGCTTCHENYGAFKPLINNTASTMLLNSPLYSRAWVFQERLLSPRVLHYSSTNMFWECRYRNCATDAVSMLRESMDHKSVDMKVRKRTDCDDNDGLVVSRSQDIWRQIVRVYSKLHLTLERDKLIAIAGIAARIGVNDGLSYIAGLWREELVYDLLWCRDFSTIPVPRPSEYPAPSWSWASVNGAVSWSEAVGYNDAESSIDILHCEITPVSKISPYGGVLGGSLIMKGPLSKAVFTQPYANDLLESNTLRSFASARWDALDYPLPLTHDSKHKKRYFIEVFCLQIFPGCGLLLRKIRSQSPDTYSRVGIFWTFPADRDYDLWDKQTITII